MQIDITIPDKPLPPPTRTYRPFINYAVMYGDRSAMVGLFEHIDEARRFADACDRAWRGRGLSTLAIVSLETGETLTR